MAKTPERQLIQSDIMRYKKNKLASTLTLLALVFGCLYFCLLYSFRNGYFATWEIGISVILTLFMMLLIFLSSEGIKNYNKKFCILMLVLAAVQIIRIFGIPYQALAHNAATGEKVFGGAYFDIDMPEIMSFTFLVVWLCASAACLIAGAAVGYINCKKLENHLAKVNSGEADVDEVLKRLNEEEARENTPAADTQEKSAVAGRRPDGEV